MRSIWILTDDRDARGLILRDDDLKSSPAIDRANAVEFRFGCFRNGVPLDLTDHTDFRFEFRTDRDTPVNLFQLLAAAPESEIITASGFRARTESHLTLSATGTQTDILVGTTTGERKLWAHLSALDSNGEQITLGKGWVVIVEDNNALSDPPVENPATTYLLLEVPEGTDPATFQGIPGPQGDPGLDGVGLIYVSLTASEYAALSLEDRDDPLKVYDITDFYT